MSTLLYDLGRWCYRHHRRVLVIWLAALAVLGAIAGLTASSYKDDFQIPGSSSQDALVQLKATFPQAASLTATAIVVLPEGTKATDPANQAAIERVVKAYADDPLVDTATSPFDKLVTGMVSQDGRAALIQLNLKAPQLTDGERESLQQATTALTKDLPAGSTLNLGGEAFNIEVPALSIIEAVGLLVALVVLVVTLGSFVAAGLPLITAIVGVGFGMVIITIATSLSSINSTTPMLAVMLGLAVGIDYALFILSRHRDQLAQGIGPEESAARAVATAGSAVVFAGLTVIIALVGLAIGGIPFLTVMGMFAAVTVAFAVVIALTLLPALMGFLGAKMTPKPNRRREARLAAMEPQARAEAVRQQQAKAARGGIFGWWVRVVTKLPALTVILVVVAMGALAFPAKDLAMALPNSGQHLPDQPDRKTYDLIAQHFGPGHNGPLIVTVDLLATNDPLGVLKTIKADIEKIPGVAAVPVATPNANVDTGFLQVVPTTAPDDPATSDLVKALRDHHDGWAKNQGVNTAVTGMTAIALDVSAKLGKALLPFGIFVVGLSLVLLTMVFRSIAVPIKAAVGYLLSVGAAFGATELVFNEGIGRRLINLDQPGPVISFLPIIVMGILFGLAMDYEVFLVSRMREDHVHGKSAREAIESGFIASGRVVTAAAVIMFAVFAFFVPEGMGPIKQIGFALAVGVALDAFVIRMTFVPAVLALLGEKAWWLPNWLATRLPSFDVEGEALNHQLSLSNWPTPSHTEAAHADRVQIAGLFGPTSLTIQPAQVVLATGDVRSRSALLLGLSGRLKLDAGRARVAGELLPDQAGKVRRRVLWVDAARAELPTVQASAAERLLVIDNADAITNQTQRDRLAELITAAQAGAGYGVLLGAGSSSLPVEVTLDQLVPVTPDPAPDSAPPPGEPSTPISPIDEADRPTTNSHRLSEGTRA